jgi:bacterioferritin-associated ferredoxin
MYVCLCKGLTEADVRDAAKARAADRDIAAFLVALDLESEEACGLCAGDPQPFIELAHLEWAALAANADNPEDSV